MWLIHVFFEGYTERSKKILFRVLLLNLTVVDSKFKYFTYNLDGRIYSFGCVTPPPPFSTILVVKFVALSRGVCLHVGFSFGVICAAGLLGRISF